MLHPLKMKLTHLKLAMWNLFYRCPKLRQSHKKHRHCERSEAIQGSRQYRLPWIASAPSVLRNDDRPHLSIAFFLIGIMGVVLGGCSSLEDSEVTMKVNAEKRKPKHELMPPEEQPVENNFQTEKIPPIAPQVGIRIPLGK